MNKLYRVFLIKHLSSGLIMASIIALSVSACSSEEPKSQVQVDEPQNSGAEVSSVQVVQTSNISLKQAIDIASQKVSGMIISAEFDDDDDDDDDKAQGGVYEIELNTDTDNHEIKVEAINGEIMSIETDRLDSGDIAAYEMLKQAKVDINEAMTIAEREKAGSVMEVKFKNDRDYVEHSSYYKMEVLTDNSIVELKIDANTGEVFNRKIKNK